MGLAPCLSYFVRIYKLLVIIKFIAITEEKNLPVIELHAHGCVSLSLCMREIEIGQL